MPVINEYNMAAASTCDEFFLGVAFRGFKLRQQTEMKMVVHKYKMSHFLFLLQPGVRRSQRPTVTHSEPCERVLAGSGEQTALLFRTTELSNIYCLVKVSVRNYDISRRNRSSSGDGGNSHFPHRPDQRCLSLINVMEC